MILIKNISQLLLMDKEDFTIIEDGYLIIKNGKIFDFGKMSNLKVKKKDYEIINADGCCLMPGFIDSHTHLFFSGERDEELEMRLKGESYYEILKRGFGIYYTAQKTKEKNDEELEKENYQKLLKVLTWGTTTIEIKSGYGIYPDEELRHLRIIKKLKEKLKEKITILPTFLIHIKPKDIETKEYLSLMKKTMEIVKKEKLAIFCDVFCEKGESTFSYEESLELLSYGKRLGLIPKIHANELAKSKGDYAAYKVGSISADHLIYPEKKYLKLMKEKDIVCTLLPGTSLFLKTKEKPPIEFMKRLGLKLAIASDYNPGTCPIYQMPIIISLGCFLYGFNEKEALYYSTMGNAYALNIQDKVGSIEKGKVADLIILKYERYQKLFYYFFKNPVKTIIKKGKIINL
uniref:Imidazolonepropionase n=1 Tax=candidate division WOR-3 bacterium TaxID=2052148 RepID=A0A7V4E463_UNCW3